LSSSDLSDDSEPQRADGDASTLALGPTGVGTRILRPAAWLAPSVAKYTHGSLVAIFNPAGLCLLVRQRFREHKAWGFPGGTHRPHEAPRDAAIREVLRETRVDIDQKNLEFVRAYDQAWAWHYDHLFSITLSFEQAFAAGGRDIKKVGWFRVSTTPPKKLTAATRYALQFLDLKGSQ
jgi:ADP-ribose pyrophosphatase YjhB (NUDIX family)